MSASFGTTPAHSARGLLPPNAPTPFSSSVKLGTEIAASASSTALASRSSTSPTKRRVRCSWSRTLQRAPECEHHCKICNASRDGHAEQHQFIVKAAGGKHTPKNRPAPGTGSRGEGGEQYRRYGPAKLPVKRE